MSYIGNNLTVQQYAPQVAYFSGNGSTTSFTLPVACVSAAQIIVVVDNVTQNPSSAYTVSGTTLTFTSAPLNGTNNIWVQYTSLQTNLIQPAAGSVGATQINPNYSLWNLSGNNINYTAGNVGIGTTSPAYPLDVQTSAGRFQVQPLGGSSVSLYNGTSGGNIALDSSGGITLFKQNGTESMRIDSSGNLLIGQTSGYGGGILDVKATVNVNASSVYVANSSYTNNALILYCNSTTTNNSYKYYAAYTNSVGYKFYVIDSGAIYSTSTSITSISDQRFKENIKDIDVGLTQVMALKPRRFDWKDGKGENRKDAVGFIAQEVQEVLPDLVTHFEISEEDKTEYLGLRSQDLIPTMVKAIQEQQDIIKVLTARIEALESK